MAGKVKVKFKKLAKNAVIPQYAHEGDVGMDLTSISIDYDPKTDVYVYHTGLSVETPKGYGIFLFPRSSNRKTDAYLANHVGIVDSATYRGEIMLCFKNRVPTELLKTDTDVTLEEVAMRNKPYNVGDRVAQMVVLPHPIVEIEEVDELSDTDRGEGGFGSTGN